MNSRYFVVSYRLSFVLSSFLSCTSDDFFPKEVDFNDLFAFDDEQLNKHSSNMDTSFENDGMDVDEKDRTKVLMIPPMMPRTNATALDGKDKTQKQKRMVKMVPVKRKLAPKAGSGKVGGRARTSKSMIEMDYDDLDDGDLTEEQRIERRFDTHIVPAIRYLNELF